MKLNHVAITATDVSGARSFLEEYFGMREVGKSSRNLAHVQDDDGLILSIFRGSSATDPTTTHIGFVQETEERVNEMYERLRADGYDVTPPQRGHGWHFHFVAPGGFAIEVVC